MSYQCAISIGGTGAKSIEALVHLCAAGLGPNNLHIFFVDPDRANGNLSRTRSLIKNYSEIRQHFKSNDDGSAQPFFKTEITLSDPDTWTIIDVQGEDTLKKYINYQTLPRASQDLVNILFSEEELTTELDEGFRGHPAIGAVVMATQDDNIDPWLSFWGNIDGVQVPGDARVFLFGSIFGASFPSSRNKIFLFYFFCMYLRLRIKIKTG